MKLIFKARIAENLQQLLEENYGRKSPSFEKLHELYAGKIATLKVYDWMENQKDWVFIYPNLDDELCTGFRKNMYEEICDYPNCKCPWDAPSEEKFKCLRGLPK